MARSRQGPTQKTTPAQPVAADREPAKKRTSPVAFLRQVRAEARKVTWPTRKETGITTAMVFVMVTIAAIFFLLVDLIIQTGIGFILDIGG